VSAIDTKKEKMYFS